MAMTRTERVNAAKARLAGKIGTVEVTFTTSEVADMIGVDRKTVARWVKAGTLASTPTVGGHARIPESAILATFGIDDETDETTTDETTTDDE